MKKTKSMILMGSIGAFSLKKPKKNKKSKKTTPMKKK